MHSTSPQQQITLNNEKLTSAQISLLQQMLQTDFDLPCRKTHQPEWPLELLGFDHHQPSETINLPQFAAYIEDIVANIPTTSVIYTAEEEQPNSIKPIIYQIKAKITRYSSKLYCYLSILQKLLLSFEDVLDESMASESDSSEDKDEDEEANSTISTTSSNVIMPIISNWMEVRFALSTHFCLDLYLSIIRNIEYQSTMMTLLMASHKRNYINSNFRNYFFKSSICETKLLQETVTYLQEKINVSPITLTYLIENALNTLIKNFSSIQAQVAKANIIIPSTNLKKKSMVIPTVELTITGTDTQKLYSIIKQHLFDGVELSKDNKTLKINIHPLAIWHRCCQLKKSLMQITATTKSLIFDRFFGQNRDQVYCSHFDFKLRVSLQNTGWHLIAELTAYNQPVVSTQQTSNTEKSSSLETFLTEIQQHYPMLFEKGKLTCHIMSDADHNESKATEDFDKIIARVNIQFTGNCITTANILATYEAAYHTQTQHLLHGLNILSAPAAAQQNELTALNLKPQELSEQQIATISQLERLHGASSVKFDPSMRLLVLTHANDIANKKEIFASNRQLRNFLQHFSSKKPAGNLFQYELIKPADESKEDADAARTIIIKFTQGLDPFLTTIFEQAQAQLKKAFNDFLKQQAQHTTDIIKAVKFSERGHLLFIFLEPPTTHTKQHLITFCESIIEQFTVMGLTDYFSFTTDHSQQCLMMCPIELSFDDVSYRYHSSKHQLSQCWRLLLAKLQVKSQQQSSNNAHTTTQPSHSPPTDLSDNPTRKKFKNSR